MTKFKTGKAKASAWAGIFLALFALLFFLLRGPYLSNYIKRIFIPYLENVTRERVIIDKAAINLLPFYLQAKGFKLFDKDGRRLLHIAKVRVYIDLLGLLSNEVRIRRLTVRTPEMSADRADIDRIIENIRKPSDREDNKLSVVLKRIKLTDGTLHYSDRERSVEISGVLSSLNMFAKLKEQKWECNLNTFKIKLPNQSQLDGSFIARIQVDDKSVDVTSMEIQSGKSFLHTAGEISLNQEGRIQKGRLDVSANIFTEELINIFALKNQMPGLLSFEGSINLQEDEGAAWPKVAFDLKTDSRFYLETLMEIINVREDVTGKLAVKGEIRGTYPDIAGSGSVTLDKAGFDTLPLDKVHGDLVYKDGRFTLNDFHADMYNGTLEGMASITIPEGNYHVTAHADKISSVEFFKYIKWEPPLPAGAISGNFQLDKMGGRDIDLTASLEYENTTHGGKGFTDRITSAKTDLKLSQNRITLDNALLSTSLTDIGLNGFVDLNKDDLALDIALFSKDVSDMILPHYSRLKGPVVFHGRAEGPLKDPEISGRLEAGPGSVHGIAFISADTDLMYRMNSLELASLKIQQGNYSSMHASGSIQFRKATSLFSFPDPFYSARGETSNLNIYPFISSLYKDLPIEGLMSGVIGFQGNHDTFAGTMDLIITESSLYSQKIDRVEIKGMLDQEKITFHSVNARNGKSLIDAQGSLNYEKRFDLTLLSKGISFDDIALMSTYPVDAVFTVDMKGHGTFENPDITFDTDIIESSFMGEEAGKGKLHGSLNAKKLTAEGELVSGSVTAEGELLFSENLPWKTDLDFREGRYDFLILSFLQEVPRDLALSLRGHMKLESINGDLNVTSRFDKVDFNFYGYKIKNENDLEIDLQNTILQIKSFYLTGADVDLSVTGIIDIFKDMDIHARGSIDIAPLRSLTEKISFVSGMSEFDVDLYGSWEEPEAIGDIYVKDGSVKIESIPYRLSNFNGTIHLNRDKIVFESIDADFAGGNMTLSGVGYFHKFNLKRIFLSSTMKGIRVRPIDKVQAVFDGSLFYESSPDVSGLAGTIEIVKARYEKNVDLASVITGVQEIRVDATEYPEFARKTDLNIRISGSENILIDNNLARTPVQLELNIMGTVDQYGLIGRVDTGEGTIYFRGNEFNILSGSNVEFIDSARIAPVFHILAETYVSSHYIKLTLDGTIDHFSLTLFSDPPLPERDILTLLTLGEVDSESRGFESGLAASEAASVLVGGMQNAIEDKFKSITGLERFRVEPYITAAGALSPRVTVEKRLLEDKLFVVYSSSIGTTEESIINLKYKLDKNISLIGTRDELGSAGGDVKFRFEFR